MPSQNSAAEFIDLVFDNLLEWLRASKEDIVTAIIKKDCELKEINEKETELLIQKELGKGINNV